MRSASTCKNFSPKANTCTAFKEDVHEKKITIHTDYNFRRHLKLREKKTVSQRKMKEKEKERKQNRKQKFRNKKTPK